MIGALEKSVADHVKEQTRHVAKPAAGEEPATVSDPSQPLLLTIAALQDDHELN